MLLLRHAIFIITRCRHFRHYAAADDTPLSMLMPMPLPLIFAALLTLSLSSAADFRRHEATLPRLSFVYFAAIATLDSPFYYATSRRLLLMMPPRYRY